MVSMFKYLCLSGGGTKGLCYIGCLKYLREQKLLDIKEIAGTSVGSLASLLILLGYSHEELIEITKTNLGDLLEPSLTHFIEHYGFDSGEILVNFIENILLKKGVKKDITLLEFYEISGVLLHIPVTDVRTRKPIILSKTTYPKLKLAQAVKMSMAVPFLFGASELEKGTVIVDGGLTLNFPIEVFNDKPHKEVLGLYLTNRKCSTIVKEDYDIQHFIIDSLYCLVDQIETLKLKEAKDNVVIIDVPGSLGLDLHMSDDQIQNMVNHGYNTIYSFFNPKTSEIG
jgi:predicted acylesterase/phospholipase RssA